MKAVYTDIKEMKTIHTEILKIYLYRHKKIGGS